MKQKGFTPILVLIIVIIVGGIAFVLGQSLNSAPETTLIQMPVASGTKSTPANWTTKISQYCDVSFPFPPKEEPYYIPDTGTVGVNDEGTFWHFDDTSGGSGWILLLDKGSTRAIDKQPDAASGYVPGSVEVFCGDNTKNYSNQELLTYLQETFKDSVKSTDEVQAMGKLVFKYDKNEQLWGTDVIVGKFVGGMSGQEPNYFFTTSDQIFMVRKVVMSSDDSIKSAADIIFQNLEFTK